MRLESPIGTATRLSRMLRGSTEVSLATWLTITGEVTAATKLETNVLGPVEPLYWLVFCPPTTAGAATVAVASYLGGARSTRAATTPPARSGTSSRIHSRRQMIRRESLIST